MAGNENSGGHGRKPLEADRWAMREKGLITVSEAARRIGIAVPAVKRWILNDVIKAEYLRGFAYVPLDDVKRLRETAQATGRTVPAWNDTEPPAS